MAINKEKNTRIVTTIDKDLKAQVEILAKLDDRPLSNYIVALLKREIRENKEAIQQYLNESGQE